MQSLDSQLAINCLGEAQSGAENQVAFDFVPRP